MIETKTKLKELILTTIVSVFFIGALYSLTILIVELRSKSGRHPSSVKSLKMISDLPSDEIDNDKGTEKDKRSAVLVDIKSTPNKTKLSGYGSYIGFRTLPTSPSIDRFLYCHNFDENKLRVNFSLNRYDLTREKRYPCVRFEIDELKKGVNLIEFLGVEALQLKLNPNFNKETGGILTISFLSKLVSYRQLQITIQKNSKGFFHTESQKEIFNELLLEFRDPNFLSRGFPTGVKALELKNNHRSVYSTLY